MKEGSIVFAGLMPHAPVLVPGVGGERLSAVAATAQAMAAVAERAVASRPVTLVLLSPHSPRQAGAFGIWHLPRLRGSLAQFDASDVYVDLPPDVVFAERLTKEITHRGLRAWQITDDGLDHGAVVPLHYLAAAGWHGPTVILSLNFPGEGGLAELGMAIAAAAGRLKRRTAIIASGDMSHRLAPRGPCGFHPNGRRFDDLFIALLREGAYGQVGQIDPYLRADAAEDATDPASVTVAAVGYRSDNHEVLSYEGPFGVGYGVAVLFEAPAVHGKAVAAEPKRDESLSRFAGLPAIARQAVASALGQGQKRPSFQVTGELLERHGVFVTLRTKQGMLRGCIGTLESREKDMVLETWRFAVAAALQDRRFPPVAAAELPDLEFDVTVLGELQPAASPADLDPSVYGVVVTAEDGRKGVLLPRIEGIETVEEQLAVARDKAGISPEEPVVLERFEARSFSEHGPAQAGA